MTKRIEIIERLGEEVERRWLETNYNEQDFPSIAADALAKADLVHQLDPWEIIRWVQSVTELPSQFDLDGRFGDPPITLFAGPRFYIDAYYWLDGTTEIHQHAFSGAFQVLLGSSIHSHYHFAKSREINPHFLLGELRIAEVRLLTRGDIHPIIAGPAYIHSLFHLDRPSTTIAVRTLGSPLAQPQYSYRKPYVALDPFYRNPAIIRKSQTVSLLFAMNHPQADEFVLDILASSDFQTAFHVLETAFAHLRGNEVTRVFGLSENEERFERLVARARQKHGELVAGLPLVFAEKDRMMEIINRRATITSEEHRFFLALLLNIDDRSRLLELVQARNHHEDPIEVVLDWVDELYATRVLGSNEENALGIKGFDASYLLVLEGLLRGSSVAEISKNLEADAPVEERAAVGKRVEMISNNLKASPLFSAILVS
jgi:hypothetical protein